MVKGPLSDKLEYAVLEIVSRATNADHQDFWGDWENRVRRLVPDYADQLDLQAAFIRLHDIGVLDLTNPDNARRHASKYSGDAAAFFFAPLGFNAVLTPIGRKYWDGIKDDRKSRGIGF